MTMSDIEWDLPTPYTLSLTVHETDVDRLGHANNVVYVRWLEDISWAHIESLGMTWELQLREGRAMAITRTEIDYLGSALAGDNLILGTWLVDYDGRIRSARRFQLVRCSDQRTIARAISRHACIDLKTQRPARIPQSIKTIMEGALVRGDID
ncbi:acyl-CoA thioesterase [Hydrocarboniclastica marina]|uniref:Acyl-CoA thioesterase n=2 Tax=Hydrocarboniclastica marina TaxID=2259620 RepID=A0A4P7XJM3_9ALTE|nr:acyl-CoA thioesterase [Hydrocarboniclastica marina]